MAAKDTPVVHFTISSKRGKRKKVETLRVGVAGGKTITFPDLIGMESVEADEKLGFIESCGIGRTWEGLRSWLSAEDVELLKAEKLLLHELFDVLQSANKYYVDEYGTPGNGTASES